MFCNHCGSQLTPSQAFCGSCGKPVVPSPTPTAASRLARHLPILAILWISISVLRLIGSGAVLMFGKMHFSRIGSWGGPPFVPAILSSIGAFLLVSAIVGLIAGFGLLQRRHWARILALVLGAISLLDPVIGTILGIYTLWVLLPAQAEQEFRSFAR